MKKIITNTLMLLGLFSFLFTACEDDIDPVIENFQFDRVFSPVNLEARIRNMTTVELSWDIKADAGHYVIEFSEDSLAFATIVKTVEVAPEDVPFRQLLEGETTYSARVKGVSTSGVADSKWSAIVFRTDAEQIFTSAYEATKTSVTVHWPAGETATDIIVLPLNVTRAVTSGEVAAGSATITGLTADQTYTVILKNGSKTRGTLSVTTLPAGIKVTPEDDFAALVAAAVDDDVFILEPGTYTVAELIIPKSISIKAASQEKPVIMSTIIRPDAGISLEMSNLILDGTGSDGNQTLVFPKGNFGTIKIDACEIKNYTKGVFYVSKATLMESVEITNTIYSSIECNGGDFIDFRAGVAKTFTFRNNTVYNSAAARDCFRMDSGGSTNFPDVHSIITIENNTFYNVTNNSGKRILYIRLADHEIHFNKNILDETQGYYTNQASTTIVEMKDNNYWNAPNFTGSTQSNAYNDSGSYFTLDPGFTDAANANFKISNQTLLDNSVGDSRWW
ncbi:MAG: DUF4957 domain-containing protein [Draconibacterium sp.]